LAGVARGSGRPIALLVEIWWPSGQNGFAAASAIVPLALGIALIAAFTAQVVRRTDGPLINLRVFRVRSYAASTGVFSLRL